MKNSAILGIVFAFGLTGFVLVLASCVHDKLLRDKTVYADGYSEKGFSQVRVGMSIPEVISLLGKPLDVATQQWSEVWTYAPAQSETPASNNRADVLTYYIPRPAARLTFSKSGLVESASGSDLRSNKNLTGQSRAEIIRRLGEPAVRTTNQFELIYRYTKPSGSNSYILRQVQFNTEFTVESVTGEIYRD